MFRRMPFGAIVSGVGSYLPERVLTNHDLERMVETSDRWIVERTGIKQRCILPESLTTSDMAAVAAARAMQDAGVGPKDIGMVVCGSFTSDYVFPSAACLVQSKLGLVNAGAFDLAAACSGFIYSICVGAHFVASGMHEHVLVIGADSNSRLVNWSDRNTCVLFGDGAGAVVLSRGGPGEGIVSAYLKADGTGWRHLHQPAGGTKCPPSHVTVSRRLHHIHMEGKETFKFASRAMSKAARAAAEAAGIGVGDVDLVVPHQANVRIIKNSMGRLGIPEERVYLNIDRVGNTVAASIGIALDEAKREGRIRKGD